MLFRQELDSSFPPKKWDADLTCLLDLQEDEGKGMVSRQLTAALHCGTVVACAIGTKSPRFCLLGSCLSQAAGFQANVPPGLLCCSETMLIQLAKSES